MLIDNILHVRISINLYKELSLNPVDYLKYSLVQMSFQNTQSIRTVVVFKYTDNKSGIL